MTEVIIEDHGAFVVTADLTPEPLTEQDIRSMYPALNEAGVANYLHLANRGTEPGFQALLARRKRSGECLIEPRIRDGEPWKSDCLVHEVEASLAHHVEMNPDEGTD